MSMGETINIPEGATIEEIHGYLQRVTRSFHIITGLPYTKEIFELCKSLGINIIYRNRNSLCYN